MASKMFTLTSFHPVGKKVTRYSDPYCGVCKGPLTKPCVTCNLSNLSNKSNCDVVVDDKDDDSKIHYHDHCLKILKQNVTATTTPVRANSVPENSNEDDPDEA